MSEHTPQRQVVVVTGGNRGIGLGMATGLVASGAEVSIWGRDVARNESAAASLRELTGDDRTISAIGCDVSEPAEVDAAMAATLGAHGRLSGLIANAGIPGGGSILDLTLAEWRRIMAVDLDGVFLTMQSAARVLVEQGSGGALLAVSSTASIHGAPGSAHYAAAKSGVLGLTKSAAVALARYGIRVNALLPGWTKADMTAGLFQDEKFATATLRRTPVRRWGEPADFAKLAVYLMDPELTFHTGDSVLVDGGYTIF